MNLFPIWKKYRKANGYYIFASKIISVGVFQGYTWIFVGLTLATIQKQRNELIPPKYKPAFPNIVGS